MHLYGLICVCICVLERVCVWFVYSHAGFDLVQPTVSELLSIFPQVHMSVNVCVWACVCVCVSMLTCSICPCAFKHVSTCHNFSQVCGCVCQYICMSLCTCLCVCVWACVCLSQQGTCRCSLFNLAGLGEEQVTSQTLFSQHTLRSHRHTHNTPPSVTGEQLHTPLSK